MNLSISRLSSRSNVSQGFTLIELLTVIAIIALLAAILFPVFSRARENARRSSCQGNMKQLGLAFQQYTQDYDETFPVTMSALNTTSYTFNNSSWAAQIYPYVKNAQVYKCPSDPAKITTTGIYADRVAVSYGANHNIVTIEYTTPSATDPTLTISTNVSRGRLSRFNNPAKTVMLFETRNIKAAADSGVAVTDPSADNSPISNGRSAYLDNPRAVNCEPATGNLGYELDQGRLASYYDSSLGGYIDDGQHFGGSNYLLADGHVKWLKGGKVSPGASAYSSTALQGTRFTSPYTVSNVDTPVYIYAAGTDHPIAQATFSLN